MCLAWRVGVLQVAVELFSLISQFLPTTLYMRLRFRPVHPFKDSIEDIFDLGSAGEAAKLDSLLTMRANEIKVER